ATCRISAARRTASGRASTRFAWSRANRSGLRCRSGTRPLRPSRPGWGRSRKTRNRKTNRTETLLRSPTMSTFEDDRYRWRETYFVLFPAARRPMLKDVEKRLAALSKRYSLESPGGDDAGRFESLTVLSPDDFAAMDVCYTGGQEVLE